MLVLRRGKSGVEDQFKQLREFLPGKSATLSFECGISTCLNPAHLKLISLGIGLLTGNHTLAILSYSVPHTTIGCASRLIPSVLTDLTGNVITIVSPHRVAQFFTGFVAHALVLI